MKQKLLIIFLFFSPLFWRGAGGEVCAQQAILDSLINEIKEHPAQDEQHLKTLNKLSYVYASMQIDSGIVAADKAIALAQKLNNQLQLAAAYNNKGLNTHKNGNTKEAYELIDKALYIYKINKVENGIADCYLSLALVAMTIADTKKSIAYSDSAIVLYKKLKNKNGLADAIHCNACGNIGVNDSVSQLLFKEALSLYEQAGNLSGQAFTWIGLSSSIRYTEGNISCMALLKKGAAIADSIQNYNAMLTSYANFNVYYAMTSNYSLQAKYTFKAIKMSEKMGDRISATWQYTSLASLYYWMDKYDEALKYALIGESLSRKLNIPYLIRFALSNTGSIYVKLNEHEKALKASMESLEISLRLNDEWGIALDYANIADCYNQKGDYKAAIVNYQKAFPAFIKIKDHYMHSNTLVGYGKAIYNASVKELPGTGITPEKKLQTAITQFEKAVEVATEGKCDNTQRDALLELSNIYSKEGDAKKSFDYYKQYVVLKDSIMNTANANSIANLQVEYDTEKKEEQIALLNKDKQIQQTEIEKQKTTRNAFIGGFVLMLMLGVVTYNRYRVKQKANAAIESTLTQLKNTQQQLIEHENLASLGKFTAATAKEIEVPLNHINNFAALNNELLFKINSKQDAATTDNILNNLKSNFQKINQYGKNADAVVKKVLVTARTLPNKV